jgi:hypothetical protein
VPGVFGALAEFVGYDMAANDTSVSPIPPTRMREVKPCRMLT